MGGVTISDELFLRLICGADRTGRGVILSDDALAAALEIADKAKRKASYSRRKIDNSNIAAIKADILKVMMEEPGIAETALSIRIGLGRATINSNPELHALYTSYRRMNSNAAPAAVNNDPDSYLD